MLRLHEEGERLPLGVGAFAERLDGKPCCEQAADDLLEVVAPVVVRGVGDLARRPFDVALVAFVVDAARAAQVVLGDGERFVAERVGTSRAAIECAQSLRSGSHVIAPVPVTTTSKTRSMTCEANRASPSTKVALAPACCAMLRACASEAGEKSSPHASRAPRRSHEIVSVPM